MVQLLRLFCGALIGLLQSSARREAEILVLRQQINVLRRKSPKRPALNNADRLLLQRGAHALIAEQGCAGFARRSGRPWLPPGSSDRWGDRLQTFCIGLRSPSDTARSGKWLAAKMAQAQQFSASGRLLGERMLAVCNAGIWRMSDDINEATRFETAPKLTTDHGVR
jgi:hypothetical protein